jgi:S-adenosylmethionine synthetase
VLVNPNGPFTEAGSEGDNGQTGRKIVMDYYGPRIPVGGGAIYGKGLTHIDRLSAYRARQFAVELVQRGADDALVRLCYAPGLEAPILIDIQSDVRPHIPVREYFSCHNMLEDLQTENLNYDLDGLGTFYNPSLHFNAPHAISMGK